MQEYAISSEQLSGEINIIWSLNATNKKEHLDIMNKNKRPMGHIQYPQRVFFYKINDRIGLTHDTIEYTHDRTRFTHDTI